MKLSKVIRAQEGVPTPQSVIVIVIILNKSIPDYAQSTYRTLTHKHSSGLCGLLTSPCGSRAPRPHFDRPPNTTHAHPEGKRNQSPKPQPLQEPSPCSKRILRLNVSSKRKAAAGTSTVNCALLSVTEIQTSPRVSSSSTPDHNCERPLLPPEPPTLEPRCPRPGTALYNSQHATAHNPKKIQ